ncbi:MAG: MFS transporter, partial [Actinomycetota bacterium]|nr:MFS transporter [Actinomycetota bacterium]
MSDFPVLRNTILLAAALTCLSGMVQLAVAVATVTLVLVTGVEGILGLGPAIFLVTSALAALPAGRAMDRFGRIPVLATGFLAGIAGAAVTGLGCATVQAPLVVVGFALVGAAMGIVLLARAAAGDMYPPERRARGISLVLFGAVFGALLGPLLFRPLFAGKELDTDALVVPWLAAAGIMVIGLVLVLCVRPDPRHVALVLGAGPDVRPPERAAPLRAILARPGMLTPLLAALASFAVMVAVMNLTGYVMVGHGHDEVDVFPVISGHIVGMYGLVLVVGDLVERIGRRGAVVGGLVVMAVSTATVGWATSSLATGVALFGLGLGWSVSYVAATADLIDRAAPAERGRLIGFSDLVSGLSGAGLALLGGVVYS